MGTLVALIEALGIKRNSSESGELVLLWLESWGVALSRTQVSAIAATMEDERQAATAKLMDLARRLPTEQILLLQYAAQKEAVREIIETVQRYAEENLDDARIDEEELAFIKEVDLKSTSGKRALMHIRNCFKRFLDIEQKVSANAPKAEIEGIYKIFCDHPNFIELCWKAHRELHRELKKQTGEKKRKSPVITEIKPLDAPVKNAPEERSEKQA